MKVNYLRIGKIVNTQGIKGEVRVIPLTDDVERFTKLKSVYLDDEKLVSQEIEYVKYHKSFVLVKFKGFDSINDVEKFKNTYMLVKREDAIKLPEGRYFICDIIGLDVYDLEGNNLGNVEDVISTGSNDVYVVKNSDGKEILIPALKDVVKDINIDENKIIVELLEGLI